MDPEYGGQGLPYTLGAVMNEFASSANMALRHVSGPDHGRDRRALRPWLRRSRSATYLPKMIEGAWSGTMNLTEPHCGTDLGLIKTKAVPQGDGSYAITGTKIFISAGEHDITENIIHLVLARIEGAPAGIKGISLFVVPRNAIDADGSVGARNGVSCGSIEHKMGIHGNATCVMNYDGARGWLIGEENKGLNAMFVMMNEARLGVAIQGLAQSEVAYQNAVAYAKDRLQGRSLTGAKAPDKPADPIIVHPDVRRTLLSIKAFNEAARALRALDRAEVRHRPSLDRRGRAPGRRRPARPDDAGAQGRADRCRLRQRREGPADVRRPWLHRRMGHGAVRPRCPHRHDLRGRQRHPGDGPRRPQARPRRRPRHHGLLQRGRRLPQGERPRTRR